MFEMHRREDCPEKRWQIIQAVNDVPVYTLRLHDDVPMSVKYPLHVIGNSMKLKDWIFSSTFDYMMALAIYERFGRIQVFGFEMDIITEWYYQRPGAYYWKGRAEGEGIEVFIPSESELIKEKLYGYDGIPRIDAGVIERQRAVFEAVRW